MLLALPLEEPLKQKLPKRPKSKKADRDRRRHLSVFMPLCAGNLWSAWFNGYSSHLSIEGETLAVLKAGWSSYVEMKLQVCLTWSQGSPTEVRGSPAGEVRLVNLSVPTCLRFFPQSRLPRGGPWMSLLGSDTLRKLHLIASV